MSNRIEPEIPNITLDRDQLKTTRSTTNNAAASQPTIQTNQTSSPSSVIRSFLLFICYVAIAGSAWYFYQQQIILNTALNKSEFRIQQLENQLSATGEEMGESTIALKVKLEAISEKTELLLVEMDKLWSSAWRKNQKQIKELSAKNKKLVAKQLQNVKLAKAQTTTINELKDKISTTEFALDAVSTKVIAVNAIKQDITKLSSTINTLDANSKTRDKQQMITASRLNELDTSIQIVIEQIETIDKKIKANTPVTQP